MSEHLEGNFATEIERADAEALGEPGDRRFRLIATGGGETTILWMEKQQLEALGKAIQHLLKQSPDPEKPAAAAGETASHDLNTGNQFRVGRLEIGYEEHQGRILIVAYNIESEEDEGPGLSGLFPRSIAEEISGQAADLVAAGRPRCVLCGYPMGPGPHACAMQNGHLMPTN